MSTVTVTTRTCDKCGLVINEVEVYIDATVYGPEFHVSCFKDMTSLELAKKLGLDDISIVTQYEPNSTHGSRSKLTWRESL